MGYHRRRVHQCSILYIVPQALSSSTNKVHVQEVSSRGERESSSSTTLRIPEESE
jgi:hypothetical protein